MSILLISFSLSFSIALWFYSLLSHCLLLQTRKKWSQNENSLIIFQFIFISFPLFFLLMIPLTDMCLQYHTTRRLPFLFNSNSSLKSLLTQKLNLMRSQNFFYIQSIMFSSYCCCCYYRLMISSDRAFFSLFFSASFLSFISPLFLSFSSSYNICW